MRGFSLLGLMRNKNTYLKIVSMFLLICTVLLAMPLAPVHAAEDSFAITVSDVHRQTLRNAFTSVSAAENYNAIEHTVDIASGTRLILGVEGVQHKGDYSAFWESTNTDVVQVTQTGEILALNVGTAKVKATAGNLMSEIIVNVHNAIEIKDLNANITLNKLCNFSLNAEGDLSKYLYSVDWVISDKNYALCGDGLVLAKKLGTCKITASIKSRIDGHLVNTSIATINILEPTTSVVVDNPVTSIELGSEYRLTATTTPAKQTIIWEAKDPGIIQFDKGVMKAVGVGKTTIYAYAGCWKNNKYEKDLSTFYAFEIQVWSSSTVKYNVTLPATDENVTVSKSSAVANEVVTIQTENVITKKLGSVEVKGVSTVSVTDASGMAVPVNKVSANVYTFIMPKSDVSIKTTYSTLYKLSYETGLAVNFARNDNAIAKIKVNEYIPGSFSGDFTFVADGVSISKIVCDYGSMVSAGADSVVYNVNEHRGLPGEFDIVVYADAQSVNAGTYSVSVTGPLDFVMNNAFTASHTNNINPVAVQVSLEYIQSKAVSNRMITLETAEQIVIHGEAMKYLLPMNLGLEIKFTHGVLTIPAASMKNLSVSDGDFTLFELKVVKDTFGAEGVYGNGTLTVKTFKPAGSVLDQISMIGNATLVLNSTNNEKLSLQTSSKTLESASNTFELKSLSGMSSFTILMKTGLIDGNVVFVIIVAILIAALAVAAWFLVKRLKTQPLNEPDPSDDDKPQNDNDDNDDDEENVVLPDIDDHDDVVAVEEDKPIEDDEPDIPVVLPVDDTTEFKSVNDILKESKLEKEVDYIKVDAIEELKNEIAREISISGSCENVLMSESQKEDLVDTLISLNLYDGSNINTAHDNFKIAINKANKCREYAVEMLRDEDVNVTEIHAQTDEMRLLNSSLAKQKEEYENLNKKLLKDIDEIYERIERLQDGKKVLANKLDIIAEQYVRYDSSIAQLKDVFATADSLQLQDNEDYALAKSVLDEAVGFANKCEAFTRNATVFKNGINGETKVSELDSVIEQASSFIDGFTFDYFVNAEYKLNAIIADKRAAIEKENNKKAELKEQLLFAVDALNDLRSNANAMVNAFKAKYPDDVDAFTELENMSAGMQFSVSDILETSDDIKAETDRLLVHNKTCLDILSSMASFVESFTEAKRVELEAKAEAERLAAEEAAKAEAERLAAEEAAKAEAERLAAEEAAKAEAERLAAEEAAKAEAERLAAEEAAKAEAERLAAEEAAKAEAERLAAEEAAKAEAERLAAEEAAKAEAERLAAEEAAKAEAERLAAEEAVNEANDEVSINENVEEVTEAANPFVVETPVYVNAEQADTLITDQQAEDSVRVVKMKKKASGKIMTVNIGSLCEHFEDGEEVNLAILKERRLISKNAERVKILAGGTMTKKLNITAHKFSLQAIKMIILAGGTVSMED